MFFLYAVGLDPVHLTDQVFKATQTNIIQKHCRRNHEGRGGRGARAPLTLKAGGLSPPKNDQ